MRSQLAQIETDIAGLRAKIEAREKHHTGADAFVGAGESFRHTEPFVKAHRAQLAALEYQYVLLKMHGEGWSAADVIARMNAPAETPQLVVQSVVQGADVVRDRLRALLDGPRQTFIPGFVPR